MMTAQMLSTQGAEGTAISPSNPSNLNYRKLIQVLVQKRLCSKKFIKTLHWI